MGFQSPPRDPGELIRELRGKQTSVAIWGTDRALLTRVGVGLAESIDGGSRWFDIRPRTLPRSEWHSETETRFGDSRFHVIDTGEMKLDEEAGNEASSILIRDEHPDPSVITLVDLMRLPQALRDAVLNDPEGERPEVILITNADRASAAFEGTKGALRPYVEALNRSGCTVLVTSCSQPRENRADLDLGFRLFAGRETASGSPFLECHSIRTPSSWKEIRSGTRFSSGSLMADPGRGSPPRGFERSQRPWTDV